MEWLQLASQVVIALGLLNVCGQGDGVARRPGQQHVRRAGFDFVAARSCSAEHISP